MKALRRQLWWRRLTSGLPFWACLFIPHRWAAWWDTIFEDRPGLNVEVESFFCRRCCTVRQFVPTSGGVVKFVNPRLNEAMDFAALDTWRAAR